MSVCVCTHYNLTFGQIFKNEKYTLRSMYFDENVAVTSMTPSFLSMSGLTFPVFLFYRKSTWALILDHLVHNHSSKYVL